MSTAKKQTAIDGERLIRSLIRECTSDAALVTAGLVLGSVAGERVMTERFTAEGIVLGMDDDGWKQGAVLARTLLYVCKFSGVPVHFASKECLDGSFFDSRPIEGGRQ